MNRLSTHVLASAALLTTLLTAGCSASDSTPQETGSVASAVDGTSIEQMRGAATTLAAARAELAKRIATRYGIGGAANLAAAQMAELAAAKAYQQSVAEWLASGLVRSAGVALGTACAFFSLEGTADAAEYVPYSPPSAEDVALLGAQLDVLQAELQAIDEKIQANREACGTGSRNAETCLALAREYSAARSALVDLEQELTGRYEQKKSDYERHAVDMATVADRCTVRTAANGTREISCRGEVSRAFGDPVDFYQCQSMNDPGSDAPTNAVANDDMPAGM